VYYLIAFFMGSLHANKAKEREKRRMARQRMWFEREYCMEM